MSDNSKAELQAGIASMNNVEPRIQDITNNIRLQNPINLHSAPTLGEINHGDFQNQKIDLIQENQVDKDLITTQLSDGSRVNRFDSYLDGVNEEDKNAQTQTTANKWTNGLNKFVTKTLSSVAGGTVGSVYGAIEAVKTGSLDAIWDNDFSNYLSDFDKIQDAARPNYYTNEEKDANFGESITTANFWANDALGGLAFTVGTIGSEAILAAATGGSSVVAGGARAAARISAKIGLKKSLTKKLLRASHLNKVKNISTNTGKALDFINTSRFVYTSAGYESGIEAKAFKDEQIQSFFQFHRENGTEPTQDDLVKFSNNLANSENAVFASNFALVGASNLALYGKMFDIKSPVTNLNKWTNRKLFGIGYKQAAKKAKNTGKNLIYEPLKQTRLQSITGKIYGYSGDALREGLVEEGGQAGISASAEQYLMSRYKDSKAVKDVLESAYEGFSHTYGSKEGWKEIGLGVIIGAIGGNISTALSGQGIFNNSVDELSKANEQVVENRNSFSADKLVDRIAQLNSMNYAAEQEDLAVKRGDFTSESLYRDMGVLSSIINSEKYEYGDEQQKDLETFVEGMSSEQVMESFGLESEDDVRIVKDKITQDYKDLRNSYNKNRRFANYQFGTENYDFSNVEGFENIVGNNTVVSEETLKDILAYQLTITERAEKTLNNYVDSYKEELRNFIPDTDKYNTSKTFQQSLRLATDEKKRILNNKKTQLRRQIKRKNKLERKIRDLEKKSLSIADTKSLALDISNAQLKLEKLRLEEENQKKELLVFANGVIMNSPIKNGDVFVDVQNVLDLEENLRQIESELNELKNNNPEKYYRLYKLDQEINRSNKVVKNYTELISNLLNPETQLKGRKKNIFSKAMRYGSLTEHTKKTLNNLRDIKKEQDDLTNRFFETEEIENDYDDIKDDETISKSVYDNFVNTGKVSEDILKSIAAKLKNNQKLSDRETAIYQSQSENVEKILKKDVSNNAKKLRQRALDLLGKNAYLLEYFGNDLKSKKPTVKDIKKYNENIKNNIEDIDLEQKLGNWRLLEGVDENGVSIKDLLDQADALEQEILIPDVIEEMLLSDDINVGIGATSVNYTEGSHEDILQSPDTVQIQQGPYKVEISHMNIESLGEVKSEPNDDGYQVVQVGENSIMVKVDQRRRLRMTKEDFKIVSNFLNIFPIDVPSSESSRYTMLYKKNESGKFVPFESEFNTGLLSSESIYRTSSNETFRFQIDMTNEWNSQLYRNWSDSKKSKNDRNILKAGLKIFTLNRNNENVGELKAIHPGMSNETFLKIREEAVRKVLKDKSVSKVLDLKFTAGFDKVFLGSPNMVLEEKEGKLIPKKIKITDKAKRNVVSYGQVKNGNVQLNPNSKINSNINYQFVENLKGSFPIMVFKIGNQNVAYPVTIPESRPFILESVKSILNGNFTHSDMVVKIANILSQNGIDPNQFNLIHTDQETFDSGDTIKELLNYLNDFTRGIETKNYLSKEYSLDDFVNDSFVTLDLENRPLRSPKLKLNFENSGLYNNLKNENIDDVNEILTDDEIQKNRNDLVLNIGFENFQKIKNNFNNIDNILKKDEIDYLKNSPKAMSNFKKVLESTNVENIEKYEGLYEAYSNDYNEIGIRKIIDPLQVKESIMNTLIDSENYDVSIETIDYPEIIKKFRDDLQFRSKIIKDVENSIKVDEVVFEEDLLEYVLDSVTLENPLEVLNVTKVFENLENLEDVVEQYDLLNEVLQSKGLDLNLDTSKLNVLDFKKIALKIENFYKNTNNRTTKDLVSLMYEFRDSKKKIIDKTILSNKVNNWVYSNTLLGEEDLFVQYGLIKHLPNIYQKVNNQVTLENLYQKINDPDDFKKEVLNDLPININSIEIAEKIAVYKKFFEVSTYENSIENQNISDEYFNDLIENFPSEFNKKILDEKLKDSDVYENFYKYFTVTNRGVELKIDSNHVKNIIGLNKNRISKKIIQKLSDYSKISKTLELSLIKDSPMVKNIDIERVKSIENPQFVSKVKGVVEKITNDEMITGSENPQFVKLNDGIYESVEKYKGKTLYKKLPIANNKYTAVNIKKPISTLNIENLVNDLNFEQSDYKKLSANKRNNIDERFFKC